MAAGSIMSGPLAGFPIIMRTVAYYRTQAAECRTLAEQSGIGEHRDRLLRMAEEWEKLANDREGQLLRRNAQSTTPPREDAGT
jgi:hypothetical protein